ncbi:hypothetical protein A3H26_02000 [candidate division WWE3 bacterium RIFCSPLOWO2_12_FULL_36_10]|uniref:Helix-turn-helix domain-containing protein n=1 Tax=candidate division WWE3 bacterium RIFCSPLOWO2_12_FULL_36_10 TaxID=1802630 RepID=A0A1F4VKN3_UNCKA|nr:MAG: hypothetical protein A3H26_02000 [candidate division WWE3 bacterium RIFCSPLOWO2_12_FULL_36_10]
MQLEDRFYTSTEVAEILGVSLRSIYRYLDENRLNAEIKTATGRHRFTRKNIMDFLYPVNGSSDLEVVASTKEKVKVSVEPKVAPVVTTPVNVVEEVAEEVTAPVVEEKVVEEDEGVDWLAKFRAAAEKHRREAEVHDEVVEDTLVQDSPKQTVSGLTDMAGVDVEVEPESLKFNFYRSGVGGLKDIAQNIDKSARKASVDYAFTMSAGLSLHKPIKPFSLIHAYVKSGEKDFFERMLQLTIATESTAQVCLIVSDDAYIYANAKEMHGLYVVSNEQLKKDLMDNGEMELAKELGA